MSDETKKLIEDLKAIRLDLFRSAANLDDTIAQLEIGNRREMNADEMRVMVSHLRSWRENACILHDWEHLDAREKEAWTKLIDSVK